MSGLLSLDLGLLHYIQSWLSPKDTLALSSTCRPLRALLRPKVFASCYWSDGREPPRSIWPLIKDLHIRSEAIRGVHYSNVFRDLTNIISIHVSGETITDEVSLLLASIPHLDCLDLSCVGRRNIGGRHTIYVLAWDPLPKFPALSCTPRAIKFGSCHGDAYLTLAAEPRACESKRRAFRPSFLSLLYEVDVFQIQELEISAEALDIPCVATYTWASLRILVLTGFHLHPEDAPQESVQPDELPYTHVHLGALLVSAPRLRTLRILCRYATWLTHPHFVAWPAEEMRPPCGSAIPALEELDLRNPAPNEGLLDQLPSTLRSLTLMTYPHLSNNLSPPQEWALRWTAPLYGTRTPEELIFLFETTALPELRELRLSFRMLQDMTLFKRIAAVCPLLELLEVHGEIGPGCLWTPGQLFDFAQALKPLRNLHCLRVDTINGVFSERLPRPVPPSDVQQLSASYSGRVSDQDVIHAFAQLTSVSELWFPRSIPLMRRRVAARKRCRRIWQVYRLLRDDDSVRLRAEPETAEMSSDDY
ncbi:hypothetical protein EV715DRAFT_292504 [Schizophyllum commune]